MFVESKSAKESSRFQGGEVNFPSPMFPLAKLYFNLRAESEPPNKLEAFYPGYSSSSVFHTQQKQSQPFEALQRKVSLRGGHRFPGGRNPDSPSKPASEPLAPGEKALAVLHTRRKSRFHLDGQR
ncbi:unnamed protein product [Phytophthora lilii]|uniref:Unnamed protein product n=1 Tax=Phytophthora lilii TaxID=2077276 RepID=A0A9W6YKN7_9STRA|nr:unnamed protein product [Phytophthora lilii]